MENKDGRNWLADCAGHLMECAAQVTGGYFADPVSKRLGTARVGFPIAEISRDGLLVITKLPTAGGRVDSQTVKEQLYYEVQTVGLHTPDVIADFSMIELTIREQPRLARGAKGRTERRH
ncbi:MAG: hypothetical protein CM1200mP41_11910 [Gammaproteobacteria bacterium]|nr:MAG: hypothetical protein CM1200mP41_11910 [Gammaproteobacteria bacterium]